MKVHTNTKNVFTAISSLALWTGFFAQFILGACSSGEKKETVNKDSLSYSNKTYFEDCKKLKATAFRMDSILLQQMEIDLPSARQAIKAFADFANYCHNDSLSPIYLIKCAQVARAINNVPQAKIVLEKCIEDYPRFRDRPAAMFLLAQLYDEVIYLNNEMEAKRLYEQIIEEYPASDWAHSAKGALAFIGKTDEQIMQTIKGRKEK